MNAMEIALTTAAGIGVVHGMMIGLARPYVSKRFADYAALGGVLSIMVPLLILSARVHGAAAGLTFIVGLMIWAFTTTFGVCLADLARAKLARR